MFLVRLAENRKGDDELTSIMKRDQNRFQPSAHGLPLLRCNPIDLASSQAWVKSASNIVNCKYLRANKACINL